jgi:hypothetical protein
MNLYCAICWFLPGWAESDAVKAVSISNGYALCEDHMEVNPSPARVHHLIAEANREEQERE